MIQYSKKPLIALVTFAASGLAVGACGDGDGDGAISGVAGSSSGARDGGGSASGGSAMAGAHNAGSDAGGSSQGGHAPTAGSSAGGDGGAAGAATGTNQGGAEEGGGSSVGDAGAAGAAGDASPPDVGPHQNPILEYAFDETSGTTAADSSGRHHDAILSAEAWTPNGRNGGALALTDPKYATVPAGVFANVTETTIAAWIKLSEDKLWSRIFDFGGSGAGTDTRFMYLTPHSPDGIRYSFFGGDPDTREAMLNTHTALPLEVWKHVAVVAAASGAHKLYIDGFPALSEAKVAIAPAELEPLSAVSYIGKSRFPDPNFEGKIDDFKVFDRVLSAAEIGILAAPQQDYTRVSFDEGTGNISEDWSDRGVDATLTSGISWSSDARLGGAVQLPGGEEFVSLVNPLAGCTDQLTIAVWVKHVTAGNWARIFDFGGTSDNFMFLTPSTHEGKLHLSIYKGGSPETIVESATTVPADGTWHHVAVTVTPAAATVFVDGESVGSAANPITPSMLGATNEHWLGKSRFPDPKFIGSFDELRVSCRAYTPDEVRNLAAK